jgi:hypothetical protein
MCSQSATWQKSAVKSEWDWICSVSHCSRTVPWAPNEVLCPYIELIQHSFSCSSQLEHRAPFGVSVITHIFRHTVGLLWTSAYIEIQYSNSVSLPLLLYPFLYWIGVVLFHFVIRCNLRILLLLLLLCAVRSHVRYCCIFSVLKEIMRVSRVPNCYYTCFFSCSTPDVIYYHQITFFCEGQEIICFQYFPF